jgi:hypothetical protein
MPKEIPVNNPSVKSLREENCDKPSVYVHELLALALKRIVRSRGLSREQVCDIIETSFPESALTAENLRHLVTDRAATFTNSLGLVAVLAALGEPEMLARLAGFAGYILVPAAKIDGSEAGLLAAAADYQHDVAETELLVAQALREGLSTELAAKILRECGEDEQKRAVLIGSVKAAASRKRAGKVAYA